MRTTSHNQNAPRAKRWGAFKLSAVDLPELREALQKDLGDQVIEFSDDEMLQMAHDTLEFLWVLREGERERLG